MATLRFASLLLFATCLLLRAAGARASSGDDGSEPPCPPGLDWRKAAEEIRTLAARGEWGQLDGVYARFQPYSCAEDLWRAVDCELEAGKLWVGQHEHITASLDSPKLYRPARRAACGRILGTAFAAVYDRASQDPDALRHARYAAIWLEVAPRTPEVQSAMASLPEEARAYARTARSLTRRPLFDAAGENICARVSSPP